MQIDMNLVATIAIGIFIGKMAYFAVVRLFSVLAYMLVRNSRDAGFVNASSKNAFMAEGP